VGAVEDQDLLLVKMEDQVVVEVEAQNQVQVILEGQVIHLQQIHLKVEMVVALLVIKNQDLVVEVLEE
tara:strand:+ start:286 stop:489 length:204 start_codon:yes stop_codon:yes gene_type:complete